MDNKIEYTLANLDGHYYLLNNVVPNVGDNTVEKLTTGKNTLWKIDNENDLDIVNQRKIIASDRADPIDSLYKLDTKQIIKLLGKVDVERLVDELWEGCDGCNKTDETFWKNGFRTGFSYSNVEKKFTLNDLVWFLKYYRATAEMSALSSGENLDLPLLELAKKYSTIEQTEWKVEVETENCKGICWKLAHDHSDDGECCLSSCEQATPKITNGYINITKIL